MLPAALVVLALGVTGAPAAVAARVVDAAASTTRAAFEQRIEYLLRDGGYWVAENPGYQGGDDQPSHFSYRFSSMFNGALMQTDIGGLFTRDRSVTYWRSITWYDADAGVVRQRNWSSDDATTAGVLVFLDDGSEMIELSGRMWDGSATTFRDISVDDGPDRFTSRSLFLVDGEWVERSVLVWERMPAPDG